MNSDTDSDFYGDDETAADLKARVKNYDIAAWWTLNNQVRSPIRQQALQKSSEAARMDPMNIDSPSTATTTTTHLHNPYAGVSYAWQLTETVDAFLSRLPPSSTPKGPQTPWIYICNPFIPRQPRGGDSQQVRGGEDEAPVERGSDLRTFCEGGMERLHMASSFLQQCRRSGIAKALVTRECNKASADAAEEVLDLAHALKVRCGKWMLFRPAQDVDETWEAIAKATADNELGIAAKVAPKPEGEEGEDDKHDRLICVYTADFRDKADVKRVAQKLRKLGLIPPRGRALYYKPDAYTYLGIARGNPWGIKASIYDTKTVLAKSWPPG